MLLVISETQVRNLLCIFLQECDIIHDFWDKFIKENSLSKLFSLGLYAWLSWNISALWCILGKLINYVYIYWNILKDRNKWVFSITSKIDGPLFQVTSTQALFIDRVWTTSPNNLNFKEKQLIHKLIGCFFKVWSLGFSRVIFELDYLLWFQWLELALLAWDLSTFALGHSFFVSSFWWESYYGAFYLDLLFGL